jgi:hypothetical protein
MVKSMPSKYIEGCNAVHLDHFQEKDLYLGNLDPIRDLV